MVSYSRDRFSKKAFGSLFIQLRWHTLKQVFTSVSEVIYNSGVGFFPRPFAIIFVLSTIGPRHAKRARTTYFVHF